MDGDFSTLKELYVWKLMIKNETTATTIKCELQRSAQLISTFYLTLSHIIPYIP